MDMFLHRLDLGFRLAAPGIVTVALTLLGVVPLGPAGWGMLAPFLPLAAVYYWAVQRPDVLTGGLLGLTAVLLLLFRSTVIGQRKFLTGKPLFVYWCGFVMAALAYGAVEWAAQSLAALTLLPGAPLLFRTMIEAAVFPVLCWVFIQLQYSLPER